MLLNKFNNELTGRLLDFLWWQWIQIGVRASFEDKERSEWIIDPEALWLLTASIGRHDPRLFDLAIDWISTNSSVVNIPRLKSISRQYKFDSERVVAAMAETVRLHNKRLKWHFPNVQIPKNPEALFFQENQVANASIENSDPVFRQFGLIRGAVELRGMATPFNYAMSECAMLRLRSMIGLNARAEIYAYLCTHPGGHPSGIARETSYSQKNIQDTIIDMSASHIIFSTQFIGRKKIYAMNPNESRSLLYNPKKPPQWISWPPLFRALEMVSLECRKLEAKEISPLFLSGRLRELTEQLRPLLEREESTLFLRPHEAFPGETYSQIFFEDVQKWLSSALKA